MKKHLINSADKRKAIKENTLQRKERLLDTAEKLFAAYGYYGVGMRALAHEAAVTLGTPTYHYGTKENLYIETFMRRLRPINAERLRLLKGAEASANGKPISVEKIVDCMLRPLLIGTLEHPGFPALLSRNLFMPPRFMKNLLVKELARHTEPFVAALSNTLPKLPSETLRMRVMFSGGALIMFVARFGQIGSVSNDPQFIEFALKELVQFTATGLKNQPDLPVPPFNMLLRFPRSYHNHEKQIRGTKIQDFNSRRRRSDSWYRRTAVIRRNAVNS